MSEYLSNGVPEFFINFDLSYEAFAAYDRTTDLVMNDLKCSLKCSSMCLNSVRWTPKFGQVAKRESRF